MNEEAQRRRELLEQTRYMSKESGIPAVHPRYNFSYGELYYNEKKEQGSLGFRTFICMILFALYIFMQTGEKDIFHVSSAKVIQEVRKNTDITDIWEKLL